MGSTKAQLGTTIDTNLADASNITGIDHRDTLKDNAENLLDEIYGDILADTHSTETYLNLATPLSAEFAIKIVKQGRQVTINGWIKSLLGITTVGTIDNVTYPFLDQETGSVYYGSGTLLLIGGSADTIVMSIVESGGAVTLNFTELLSPNETAYFKLTYNTQA